MFGEIIIAIAVTWYVTIPFIFRLVCRIKDKWIPNFFRYGYQIFVVLTGAVVFNSIFSVDMDYETNQIMADTVCICYEFVVIVSVLIYNIYNTVKIKKRYNSIDKQYANLSLMIAKEFGIPDGYSYFQRKYKDYTKNEWYSLIDYCKFIGDNTKLNSENLVEFKEYVNSVENHATKKNDSKLLSVVYKAKAKYF
jgi:hypothetical protein